MYKKALVTGSSGMVGSEMVRRLCNDEWQVIGIDNDSRGKFFGPEGSVAQTEKALRETYPNYFTIPIDLRDENSVKKVFTDYGPFDLIAHIAGQPAHEYSTDHALEDFGVNAAATVNMLENYRHLSPQSPFIHVSSSKVYGDSVNNLPLVSLPLRFDLPKDHPYYEGVDEEFGRLDGNLHSLFGASKACGDIMALEYARYFSLPLGVFRPVCITSPAHKGVALHGYLAYLVRCVAEGIPYTINGYDGKQVRDNIHSYDLVSAFLEFAKQPRIGEAYNIGAGRASNSSVLEALQQAEELLKRKANYVYSPQNRRGDHKWAIYSAQKFRSQYPDWKLTYNNDRIMEELCEAFTKHP